MTTRNKIGLLLAVLAVLLLIGFGLALRSYDSYEVLSREERADLNASHFVTLGSSCLEYANDGVSCLDADGNWAWNQAYEMDDPRMDKSGDYLVIYEKNGTEVWLMTEQKVLSQIEAAAPIVTASLASDGRVALLMRQEGKYLLALYDREGDSLADGTYYTSQKKIPVDLALSDSGELLVIDTVDISSGSMNTTLDIYRFSSDREVESVTLGGCLVPEIFFLKKDTFAVLTDSSLCLYEAGTEETTLKKELAFDETPDSVFYSESLIGLVAPKDEESGTRTITVYNGRGHVVMEYACGILFHSAKFLDNGEICVFSESVCEIYTKHSIRKFSCGFDESLYDVQYAGSGNNYRFMTGNAIESVRLD